MRNFVTVFGDKPRIRLLEALLALAPYEFTRGEAAEEADLPRASVNRVFPELEELGVVHVAEQGAQPVYQVDAKNEVFRILQYLDHALGLALHGSDADTSTRSPSARFRKRVSSLERPRKGRAGRV